MEQEEEGGEEKGGVRDVERKKGREGEKDNVGEHSKRVGKQGMSLSDADWREVQD